MGSTPSLNGFDRLIQLYGDTILQGNPGGILRQYPGGPGSSLGVGKTLIRFATSNTGAPLRTADTPAVVESAYATLGPAHINDLVAATSLTNPIYDFRDVLRRTPKGRKIPSSSMASTLAPPYQLNGQVNIESRVNLNNPAAAGRNLTNYVDGTGKGIKTYDAINAFPLYRSEIIPTDYAPKINDLVKFRIAAIDNDNPKINEYIHFRAFLGSITDNYTAQWEDTQYMGRGDKLYSYKGFNRTLSLSWTIAAQSKKELIPMYQKLNFLASNLAPDYNDLGYMRGPLINLTIGGYLYEVPGFITSMTVEMSDEYPWEIGILNNDTPYSEDPTVKELPQIIRVSSFNFTPIHRFIPRKQVNTYGGGITTEADAAKFLAQGSKELTAALPNPGKQSVGPVTQFGSTRFISLNTGTHNNYDEDQGIIMPDSI